ncbi:beta-N-acetylhexosaminidase [Niabella drilacis]|uniref:beta-N-acetylhexosaminidase n=1 Tax=Niabella drilacis (strain DSM 25811 / CCM 8410 / CCUG 62505 / LMG 26954 / E90) TaxID=1285928 RepID=A0A1G6X332_NIADE|nr:family 20 glycosylhydrolase [Niabella drilacis]SDD71807.1 hexosaminidase [Niabella drilacis]
MKKNAAVTGFCLLALLWMGSCAKAVAQIKPAIVPEPVSMVLGRGTFVLDAQTSLTVSPGTGLDRYAPEWLREITGLSLPVKKDAAGGQQAIRLVLDPALTTPDHDEGYQLSITEHGVMLKARKAAGLFYGLQTIGQLLQLPSALETQHRRQLPVLEITDYPRFRWRGLMLDVSRHFFPKEFVKKYIDDMARYKFNIFHWHLTDDQGWRIEIKSLPRLTEIGAWRVPRTGQWWSYDPPQPGEKPTYGGYYTQEDIKEIIAYAAERHITIVPEIDVPGHSLAAIAAYPYLSATGYLYAVNPGSKFYNIEDNTLNPADERVYGFLDKVFTEVAALFPGTYIHIGGDECTKLFWQRSAVVQDFMKQQGIKTEHELQSYFIKRVEKILKKKGKKLIGWDEILEGGLAPDATVMSWRGIQGGIEAAKQGHQVILTPNNNVYLDLYQGDPLLEPDTYSMLRLKTSYQWDPVPQGVNGALVLGGQGNLWTESVPGGRHAEYMTWPRSLALAEVFWSPKDKQNWSRFQEKLEPQFKVLDAEGVHYSRAAFDILATAKHDAGKQLLVSLGTDIDNLDIYYTLDNTNPDTTAARYTGTPILVPRGCYQLRARSFKKGTAIGQLLIAPREALEKRAQ